MQSKRESRYETLVRSRRPIHDMSHGDSCAYVVRCLVWLYVAGLAQTGCPFKITMTWRVGAPNPTITSVRIDNSWLGMYAYAIQRATFMSFALQWWTYVRDG